MNSHPHSGFLELLGTPKDQTPTLPSPVPRMGATAHLSLTWERLGSWKLDAAQMTYEIMVAALPCANWFIASSRLAPAAPVCPALSIRSMYWLRAFRPISLLMVGVLRSAA